MSDSVWREFFRTYNRLNPDVQNFQSLLFDFLEENIGIIITEEKNNHSIKSRLSVPANREFGVSLNVSDEIKKALMFAERVVVSPAAPLTCTVSRDSRYSRLTSDSLFLSPNLKGIDGKIVTMGLGHEWSIAESWLIAARPLLENGRLNYLPFVGCHDGPGKKTEQPSYHGGYNTFSWHTDLFDLPYEAHLEDNGHKWQTENIARDWLVADKLGCNQLLPVLLENPVLLKSPNWNTNSASLALSSLSIPDLQQFSLEQLAVIIEEEQFSFHNFVKSIRTAVDEISYNVDMDEAKFQHEIEKIQKQKIDAEIDRLNRKIERLTKYQAIKFGGYAAATTTLLALSIFAPGLSAAAAGAVGGISLIKLYDSVVGMIEKKDGIIRDDSQSFLGRITVR